MYYELISGIFNYAISGVTAAAIIERGMLIVEAQTGKACEVSESEGALMIGGHAIVLNGEIAAEDKLA